MVDWLRLKKNVLEVIEAEEAREKIADENGDLDQVAKIEIDEFETIDLKIKKLMNKLLSQSKFPHINSDHLDKLRNRFAKDYIFSRNERIFWAEVTKDLNIDDCIDKNITEGALILKDELNTMEKLELEILRKFRWFTIHRN